MKTVLHISGPSCSGKSTIEAALASRLPGTYTVAYDKLKWQLAGYHRDKDRETIRELLVGFFEVVCRNGLPVFLQAYMRSGEEFDRYAAIASEYGYEMTNVRITAPKGLLLERFRERVARATAEHSKRISVTDEGLFLKNLEMHEFIPPNTTTYDSSLLSPEEIADAIYPSLISSKAV